jgi:hypothetical protein
MQNLATDYERACNTLVVIAKQLTENPEQASEHLRTLHLYQSDSPLSLLLKLKEEQLSLGKSIDRVIAKLSESDNPMNGACDNGLICASINSLSTVSKNYFEVSSGYLPTEENG